MVVDVLTFLRNLELELRFPATAEDWIVFQQDSRVTLMYCKSVIGKMICCICYDYYSEVRFLQYGGKIKRAVFTTNMCTLFGEKGGDDDCVY